MILYSMNLNPRIKCLNLYLLIILIYLKLNSFNIDFDIDFDIDFQKIPKF